MEIKYLHFKSLASTNVFLQEEQKRQDIANWVVSTDEQTSGKGMGTNTWESAPGQNLTFSIALDVSFMEARNQFVLAEAVPLALLEVLDTILLNYKLNVKWPNDIYYDGRKLAGILTSNTISGEKMAMSIAGIGLNVNQEHFKDWPTHPVSLRMITGDEYDCNELLPLFAESIVKRVSQLADDKNVEETRAAYLKRLYRYQTWNNYEIGGQVKLLFMSGIDTFGKLQLVDRDGKRYLCDIKEIKFIP